MNKYRRREDYVELMVDNSDEVYIFDYKDFDFAIRHHWFATGGNYRYLRAKSNGQIIKFHIEIMKKEILEFINKNHYMKRAIVDHRDGDYKNNRRKNLRVRTQSENNMNKNIQSNNKTGIVGVSWHKRDKMWSAKISVNNKSIHLGEYYYLRNAVKSRIEAENKHFGEHAFRNRERNEYNIIIDKILSLPNIEEPIFTTKRGKYSINGVSDYRNGFRARIYYNKKEESKTFDNLSEAIKWR